MRMTFVEPLRSGSRRHGGWTQDRHLRKGAYFGFPLFVVGAVIGMLLLRARIVADVATFFAIVMPFAVASNVVWLAVSAWSRHKAGEA